MDGYRAGPSVSGLFSRRLHVYQLWLRNVAVNLTPVDFLILVDMARAALQEVRAVKGLKKPGERSQVLPETVKASAGMSFSIESCFFEPELSILAGADRAEL